MIGHLDQSRPIAHIMHWWTKKVRTKIKKMLVDVIKKDWISNTRHISKDELKRIAKNDKGIRVLYEYSVEKEGWMSNLQGGMLK